MAERVTETPFRRALRRRRERFAVWPTIGTTVFAQAAMFFGCLFTIVIYGVIAHLVESWLRILLPFLALQGTLAALAYRRTGSLWVPIGAHAINNLFAFLAIV